MHGKTLVPLIKAMAAVGAALVLAACPAPVTPPAGLVSISLDREQASVAVHETVTLVALLSPVDASAAGLRWSSSNGCASVDAGVVTGLANGHAVITVASADGSLSASCDLRVTASAPLLSELVGDWKQTTASTVFYISVQGDGSFTKRQMSTTEPAYCAWEYSGILSVVDEGIQATITRQRHTSDPLQPIEGIAWDTSAGNLIYLTPAVLYDGHVYQDPRSTFRRNGSQESLVGSWRTEYRDDTDYFNPGIKTKLVYEFKNSNELEISGYSTSSNTYAATPDQSASAPYFFNDPQTITINNVVTYDFIVSGDYLLLRKPGDPFLGAWARQ